MKEKFYYIVRKLKNELAEKEGIQKRIYEFQHGEMGQTIRTDLNRGRGHDS